MRKADGVAFEREFRDKMQQLYYVRRLPTLKTGYAGLTQPADFILVGDRFNYVEVKETGRETFSISTMQQYEEIKAFMEQRKLAIERGNKCIMNYWLIVRFIDKGVCAISNEMILQLGENRKTLKYNSPEAIRVDKVEQLREENIF